MQKTSTHSGQCLETAVVALDSFHPMASGITSIAIHFKGDVLGDGALPQSADEEVAELVECPFARR